MATITRDSLFSLEEYSKNRSDFKKKVIAHKHFRKIHLGENVTLMFEDELTMRYQIQEMLRIEKIFEEEGIQDELNAYNPLVPNGSNWKSTMLIEYPNPEDRKLHLSKLIGIEDNVYVKVEGFDRVYAIADEDLDRENEEKTSAVHFLRFELNDNCKQALKSGAKLFAGVCHENYNLELEVEESTRQNLINDLVI